jgi:hypothetical protein
VLLYRPERPLIIVPERSFLAGKISWPQHLTALQSLLFPEQQHIFFGFIRAAKVVT